MTKSNAQIRARAAALAEELSAGVREGRTPEWVEEVLGSVMVEVMRDERERCALIAEHRAELWDGTARRMSSGQWPGASITEARERHKEAVFIADAIRTDQVPSP